MSRDSRAVIGQKESAPAANQEEKKSPKIIEDHVVKLDEAANEKQMSGMEVIKDMSLTSDGARTLTPTKKSPRQKREMTQEEL